MVKPTPSTPIIDALRVRRAFARAAGGYEAAAAVPREVASRMLERLDYVKIDPRLVVDLGCGAGGALNALGERYPRARLVGIDACEAMLRVGHERRAQLRWLLPFLPGPKRSALIAADAQALPLAPGAAGLVWSNLMLHWLADPLAGLREAQRALETGGLLMFSTLGPDSLKEVRACFGDGHEHTLRFIDMHDYGDMLIGCGFADPVMDAERLTVTYPTAAALFAELRQTGSTCAAPGRRRGLMGRRTWQAACRAYERHADGRLPVTLEVIYGHAWKAEPRTAPDGRKVIRFAERE